MIERITRNANSFIPSFYVFTSIFAKQKSVFDFQVGQIDLGERADLLLGLLLGLFPRRELDVRQVAEGLVGRQRELAVLVDALLAFLDLLRRRLARGRPQRAGREVDAELLRGPQQLVVLLAHLDL